MYPSKEKVWAAFDYHELSDLKVVILGQDPYHTPDVANGLAFSTAKKNYIPPSLVNIIKEMKDDIGYTERTAQAISKSDYTKVWGEHIASQGVLLLNTALTVLEGQPNSLAHIWLEFTADLVKAISDNTTNVVWILWGAHAQSYAKYINDTHYVIKSAHPSPLSASRGFFGSKPFSAANTYLLTIDKKPIDW